MKELKQSVINLPLQVRPEKIVDHIEKEVKKHWDQGWLFVKAEPDKLLESVCIYFEREVIIDE
ncbi:MAG: hypothetical protein HQK83_13925 [Fibrobacteria bacterium]|nr:hypothetical protein [Fibrobacteria bacterium]